MLYFSIASTLLINVRLCQQADLLVPIFESVTLLIYKLTNKLNRVE